MGQQSHLNVHLADHNTVVLFGYRWTSTKDGMQQLYNPCYHRDWPL